MHATCWAEMATELASHWQGEETGLFRVMAGEEMFAEHIAPLVREHHEPNPFRFGWELLGWLQRPAGRPR
jgi:hypothetical protein